MASIFSKIAAGEIPSYKIAENENYFAFLDINPIRKGHALVIPKQEVDYIFDLDADTLGGLHVFAQKVAKAIDKTIPCKRVAVIVLGLESPSCTHSFDTHGFRKRHPFLESEIKTLSSGIH